MPRPLALASLAVALSACAFVQPRFSQNVEASFAQQPMRKLTTSSLELYYPARHQATALRVAARLERCVERLRQLPLTQKNRGRAVIVLTDSVFNNAYVQPASVGVPQEMLLPHHMTLELFNWFELGVSEIEDISCHESVHYVQLEQTDGFFGVLNLITGGIWQPNEFTESWFLEGLATYYEGRLDKEVGRPHSMFWHGLFDSGAAQLGGELHPGYLNVNHRDALPFGGNYLVGQRFVEYLARTYGEDKLWELVDLQGHSVASPLAVTLRFRTIYGETIGGAFDDFRTELSRNAVLRQRPATQHVLREDAGYLARLAASRADGALALVTVKRDDPTRLTLYEADGSVRFSRRLTEVLPGRRWIEADPSLTSGMSFSADGRWLYLVSVDVAEDGSDLSQLWQVDAHSGDVVHVWGGIDGFGGSLSPDGKGYVFIGIDGDTANLFRLDLTRGTRTPLTHFSGRESLGAPAWGSDGRIAFSRWMGEGWDLWLRSPDGELTRVTQGSNNFNYGAQWMDPDHLLLLGAREGRWQIQRRTLSTGETEWLSDAPYIALDPVVQGDHVAFLNRTGWSWSLDAVPLPLPQPIGSVPFTAPPPPPEAPATPEPAPAAPIVSDEPYSTLDHLWVPTLRLPFALVLPEQSVTNPSQLIWGGIFGGSLAGADRLGFHNYALNAIYDSGPKQLQVSAAYGNYQFAPWFTQVTLSRLSDTQVRDLEAMLSSTRTFWTTPVTFGLQALDRTTYLLGGGPERDRFVGPNISLSYFGGEGTAYGGTQRGLGLSMAAAVYSSGLGSTLDMADLRGEVDGYIPLPFLKRHSFVVSLVGRALPGAPDGLLRVGGVINGYALAAFNATSNPNDQSPINLPADIAFSENLRGYEDFGLHGTRAGTAYARYRIPWIFDWGSASTLYVGPSFFLSEIDFEAFGSAAVIDSVSAYHRAAGGAVLVRTVFGQIFPLTLYAQFAYRFDDGLSPLTLVGVALE